MHFHKRKETFGKNADISLGEIQSVHFYLFFTFSFLQIFSIQNKIYIIKSCFSVKVLKFRKRHHSWTFWSTKWKEKNKFFAKHIFELPQKLCFWLNKCILVSVVSKTSLFELLKTFSCCKTFSKHFFFTISVIPVKKRVEIFS